MPRARAIAEGDREIVTHELHHASCIVRSASCNVHRTLCIAQERKRERERERENKKRDGEIEREKKNYAHMRSGCC